MSPAASMVPRSTGPRAITRVTVDGARSVWLWRSVSTSDYAFWQPSDDAELLAAIDDVTEGRVSQLAAHLIATAPPALRRLGRLLTSCQMKRWRPTCFLMLRRNQGSALPKSPANRRVYAGVKRLLRKVSRSCSKTRSVEAGMEPDIFVHFAIKLTGIT